MENHPDSDDRVIAIVVGGPLDGKVLLLDSRIKDLRVPTLDGGQLVYKLTDKTTPEGFRILE